jgi:predicted nucleic acid-binding protein
VGALNEYLVDTVAFVRYLEDRLPAKADRIFEEAESGSGHLLLPQIALGEFLYLALRGRLRSKPPQPAVNDVLQNLAASDTFSVTAMPWPAWDLFPQLKVPELHDRMIAAEALARKVPIISNDEAFLGVDSLRVIW